MTYKYSYVLGAPEGQPMTLDPATVAIICSGRPKTVGSWLTRRRALAS
jgi:hypothetical protein